MSQAIHKTTGLNEVNPKLYLARLVSVGTTLFVLLLWAPAASAVPSGEEVLSRLREFDAMYESGLTATAYDPGEEHDYRARGSMGAGLPSRILPPIPRNWKLTMAPERCALIVKSVEVPLSTFRPVAMTGEEAKAQRGRPAVEVEDRTFWGPDYMAKYQVHRGYSCENDEVKMGGESTGVNFLLPDDTSWNLPLHKFLWSMGRGYSEYILELNSVVELEDGTIRCSGPGTDSPHDKDPARWELVVDPAADYMVRSAKFTEQGDDKPGYEITTSGTKVMNGRIAPETATWQERRDGRTETPMRLTFQNVTQEPDYALLGTTEKMMFGPYEGSTRVYDERTNPPFTRRFKAGETYETFRIIRQTLVGRTLEGLENFGLKLDENQIKDKMVLVCFWDMNQRPSRHFIKQLAGKAEELKQKDIVVVTVQCSKVEKKVLDEWLTKNEVDFPIGIIKEDEEKTRHAWAIKSLPWLILTDRNHVVTAEGFGIEELEEKMKAASEHKPNAVQWSGEEVLEKLREYDALYFKKGFSARGAITAPAEPGIGKPEITRRWELTAQGPQVALVFEVNEADIPKPKFVHTLPDRYARYTPEGYWLVAVMMKKYMYFGTDWIGRFVELNHYAVDRRDKIVNVGDLHRAGFCEPADEGFGPFWERSELLWSLGRGYSEIIHEITRVEQLADGRLVVSALGLLKTGGERRDQWELTIDPKAAWTVRHARCNWDPDGGEVEFEAQNSGLIWNGPLAMPKRITWQRPGWRAPHVQQISCKALEAKVNEFLLSKARAVILPPYPADTEVDKYTRDDVDDDYDAEELLKLVGQPLPPFESIGIGFGTAEAKGKDILVCFFDMNQRPSRHMVTELAKLAPRLREKGVVVLCVQASKVDKEKLDEWAKDSNIPFTVRIAEDDASKIRFTWCVKSLLPWLILTDKEHIVTAEGFGLEELDEKIKESEDNYGKN